MDSGDIDDTSRLVSFLRLVPEEHERYERHVGHYIQSTAELDWSITDLLAVLIAPENEQSFVNAMGPLNLDTKIGMLKRIFPSGGAWGDGQSLLKQLREVNDHRNRLAHSTLLLQPGNERWDSIVSFMERRRATGRERIAIVFDELSKESRRLSMVKYCVLALVDAVKNGVNVDNIHNLLISELVDANWASFGIHPSGVNQEEKELLFSMF